jgi:hypothetical protein
MKPYYILVDRFARKSCGANFKVQGNSKLDDVVGPGIALNEASRASQAKKQPATERILCEKLGVLHCWSIALVRSAAISSTASVYVSRLAEWCRFLLAPRLLCTADFEERQRNFAPTCVLVYRSTFHIPINLLSGLLPILSERSPDKERRDLSKSGKTK